VFFPEFTDIFSCLRKIELLVFRVFLFHRCGCIMGY
jgi:hypothetical protein